MSLFFLLPTGGVHYTVTGATINDDSTSRTCTARLTINADGTIDKLENVTTTQLSSDTDWVTPNEVADGDHDVRITNVVWTTGAAFTNEAAAEDAWIDLSVARVWDLIDTNSSPTGNLWVDFDIEIRDPGGSTVASGSYTMKALYDNS